MQNLTGKYSFVVEPFSEDFMGRLSWGIIGNQLLRCASWHAGSHGFGYRDVVEKHHAWVLSRLVVEFEQMPITADSYCVETWVSRIYRQFTDRLFAITGADGKVYGYASSIWALIDIGSRQPMDFSLLPEGGFRNAVVEREVPIQGPGRVRVKTDTPVHTREACYSDLDINGHVNSIRYIEMILDLFKQELYEEKKTVRRVEMSYSAESYCGDVLDFYLQHDASHAHQVEIRKRGGETVVKAIVFLQ